VIKDRYIFGFDKGIAKYKKSFKLSKTYESKAKVFSIVAYHNDINILILGELKNNIEVVDHKSMALLTHF
jgi:hypothetical protein